MSKKDELLNFDLLSNGLKVVFENTDMPKIRNLERRVKDLEIVLNERVSDVNNMHAILTYIMLQKKAKIDQCTICWKWFIEELSEGCTIDKHSYPLKSKCGPCNKKN